MWRLLYLRGVQCVSPSFLPEVQGHLVHYLSRYLWRWGEDSWSSNYIICGLQSISPSLASHIPQCSYSECCVLMRLSDGLWHKNCLLLGSPIAKWACFFFSNHLPIRCLTSFLFPRHRRNPFVGLSLYKNIHLMTSSGGFQTEVGGTLQSIILNSVLPCFFSVVFTCSIFACSCIFKL